MRIELGAGQYPQTDEGLRQALRDGHRWFHVPRGIYFRAGVNLDEFDNAHLAIEAGGFHTANLVKTEPFPTPLLYSYSRWWQLFWSGFAFQGQYMDAQPLTHFEFADRGYIREVGYYDSGGPGARWATKPDGTGGTFSLFDIHRLEVMRCLMDGWEIGAGRNLSFDGRSAFERNGLASPRSYHGLKWTGNPANPASRVGHSNVTHVQFEHDDAGHTGLYLRNLKGMEIGYNRHVLAGYDVNVDDSEFHPSTVYEGSRRVVNGRRNTGLATLTGKPKDLILPVQPENG